MMTLRSKLVRLAHENPALRPHLLPLLKEATGQWTEIGPGGYDQYREIVWGMYEITYRQLGLIISSPQGLNEFDVWSLCFDGVTPVAFKLSKKTRFGVKGGLAGSDGSQAGRGAIKSLLGRAYRQPGQYSEVSHGVEKLVLAGGAPVICAAYVPEVLGKPIKPSPDGLHYTRVLAGVGPVEKIMVGTPRGIPTTSANAPSCPIMEEDAGQQARTADVADSIEEHATHLGCMLDWD